MRKGPPNSRYEDAQHSSAKSLTAIVEKSDDGSATFRIGPAVLANGGICAITEVQYLPPEEQSRFLSIMEEDAFSINKQGYNQTIKASTAFIFTANPANGGSTWASGSSGDTSINLDEIPIIKPLLDRV